MSFFSPVAGGYPQRQKGDRHLVYPLSVNQRASAVRTGFAAEKSEGSVNPSAKIPRIIFFLTIKEE